MKNRVSSIVSVVLAFGAIGGVALACVIPQARPADGVETPGPNGCAGCTTPYVSCPKSDRCISFYAAGFDSCVVQGTLTVPCSNYSGLTPAVQDPITKCCSGGTLIGNSATTVTIVTLTGKGDCTEPF